MPAGRGNPEGRLVRIGSVESLRQQEKPRLEISGSHFSEGILAALRAYPDVQSVIKNHTNGLEDLQIELRQQVDSAPLIQTIVNAGGQIEEVKRNRSSLEDIFLGLVRDQQEEQDVS